MDDIIRTSFSSVFSWKKMLEFRLSFHWSLFPGVWQYSGIGSDNGLAPNRRQATIWTNDVLGYWRIYALLGLNELSYITLPQIKKIQNSKSFYWLTIHGTATWTTDPSVSLKSKKQTNAGRKPGGDTFHVISNTFHGRLKMKGYQFQVQLWIKCDTFESRYNWMIMQVKGGLKP